MPETRIPEALALLREKGWCKGTLEDERGRFCIRGALLEANEYPHYGTSFNVDLKAVGRVLREQYGVCGVATWNDNPATTFEMVEAVLEKAALERGGAL